MPNQDGRPFGRTSWRRFLVIAVPALGVAVGVLTGTANGAVPVSFASGAPFRVTVERMDATGFGFMPGISPQTGALALRTRLPQAEVRGMCQSQTVDLPVIGTVTMKMTAQTVHATDLVIDARSAAGRLNLQKLVIGPVENVTGYHTDTALLENVTIEAGSATAGTFAIDGVDLSVSPGANPCRVLTP